MTLFKNKYRIESTRLPGYDYSSNGAYFITICTKNRIHHFGEIEDGNLIETFQAKIAKKCWLDLPNHYPQCVLDEFVIMPNHVHGIIIINNHNEHQISNIETGLKPISTRDVEKTTLIINKRYSLSEMVRAFKTFSARKINKCQNAVGRQFWQLRFYDHIIREGDDIDDVRQYIINNPANWERDRNNSENLLM